MDTLDTIAPAAIGHNGGPALEPTPYERAKKRIEDLFAECKLWLDGKPVEKQAQADDLANLLAMLREAETEADDARLAEKAPHDEKITEIQARYAPLIANTKTAKGKTVLAIAGIKKALEPWLTKVAAEKAAAAEKARQEAEEKRRAAEEAIRASDAANLAQREAAEALVADAKKAEKQANRAEKATANAGGGIGRAVGLRTLYRAEITDPIAFGRHCWAAHRDDYLEFLAGLAKSLVAAGKRDLPGVTIHEEKVAV
jgi:hypothetical protein